MKRSTAHTRKAYRNEKLAVRFYFYNNLMGLRYETCSALLEQEFDISSARIYELINENSHHIDNCQKHRLTIADLRKRYPFLNWNYHHATRYHTLEQWS